MLEVLQLIHQGQNYSTLLLEIIAEIQDPLDAYDTQENQVIIAFIYI